MVGEIHIVNKSHFFTPGELQLRLEKQLRLKNDFQQCRIFWPGYFNFANARITNKIVRKKLFGV